MLTYSRTLDPRLETEFTVAETEFHIRSHLSSCASETDSDVEYAGEVVLTSDRLPDGKLHIVGTLDRSPVADYLKPGYQPDTHHHFQRWEPRA